jgi:hypothetical protein
MRWNSASSISSLVMPAIFLKHSAAAKRQEVNDFAAQQELHRALNSNVRENSINVHQQPRNVHTEKELEFDCETALEILLGFNPDPASSCAAVKMVN